MKREGFMMVEVLIAVAVLATVCTASLRLSFLAQNSLIKISEREELLRNAREIAAGIHMGVLESRGARDGFEWTAEEKEAEMFGEDFGTLNFEGLNFDNTRALTASETIKLNWKEVTVKDAKENALTIYMQRK